MDTSPAQEETTLGTDDYAVCPDCKTRIHCGSVGLANLEKNHRGKKICVRTKEKHEKEEKAAKRPNLLSFFTRPKAAPVPSTLLHPTLLQGQKALHPVIKTGVAVANRQDIPLEPARALVSANFLKKLHDLIKNLPSTIPEASDHNRLAVFEANPMQFDDPTLDADELWENVLNGQLKLVLGWGVEEDMDGIIQRGKKGFDSLESFVKYFIVKRGVDEALFEGKLSCLMIALQKKVSSTQEPVGLAVMLPRNINTVNANDLLHFTEKHRIAGPEHKIVDVETFAAANTELVSKNSSATKCGGYHVVIPNKMSPYSAYPLALHDARTLPWTCTFNDSGLTLFARSCTGRPGENFKSCKPCRQLAKNSSLEGILTRMMGGVHVNTPYAFYGFSDLQDVIHQKNQQIEFYRFRGLNQAKKLLGKATALSKQKRLLLAIASGEVQRVDHIISIGLLQKKGARGLLASVLAAAQGHYRPKSYTEEEDMKALLIWRLSGNRVASIYQKSTGGPSVSYLRTRSIVPTIIPSHEKPTEEQVTANVEASLESILDIIHSQIGGKVLHTVVMFDKLATEKRIRWDPKSNHFLGVCRQHAYRTSTEFVNKGDLEELFRHLESESENEKVHYAGEATVGALGILCKDHRVYPGQPVLVSGDCKCESGEEHSKVIQIVLDGVNSLKEKSKLRTVSIASDGETRRGSSFILLTFKHPLSPRSPIYCLLRPLKFLDLHVGDDDLTCDKDWKHIFKHFRNLLLRQRGVVINCI